MAKKHSLKLLLEAVITCFSLYLIPAFAATPGTWDATADFGAFELVVSSDGSKIENITYHFSDWTCGSVNMNGTIGITPGTPWPINGDAFSLTTQLDPDREITVSGSFGSAAQASGNWDADIIGTNCDGAWEATNGDAEMEIELTVDHAFVQGVYWNPDELPGWGFFVDVQEELFFGAIYGYLGDDSTFIIMQGTISSTDPPVYQGDVFFISNGGATITGVGNFTWNAGSFEASAAAMLTLTSNILDVTDLSLVRFSYAEIDNVDVITGGDWNIIRRLSGNTFGDHYAINDMRILEDGITYAGVTDLGDNDKEGLVGFFPDDDTDFYGMLVEFDGMTDVLYIFLATNADMYGRYWILEPDDEPTGSGDHFRAAADTFQAADMSDSGMGEALQSVSMSTSKPHDPTRLELKALEILEYENSGGRLEPMFEDSRIQYTFKKLSRRNRLLSEQMQ